MSAPAPSAEAVAVRAWEPGDSLPALQALVHKVFGALAIDPPSSATGEGLDDFAKRLRTQAVFVAVAGGNRIVGAVFCAPRGDALYVGRLAVDPRWRGRGLARALMRLAQAEGVRRGAAALTLRARLALPENLRLFRSLGFVATGEGCHPGYTAPTFQDMALDLRAAPAEAHP